MKLSPYTLAITADRNTCNISPRLRRSFSSNAFRNERFLMGGIAVDMQRSLYLVSNLDNMSNCKTRWARPMRSGLGAEVAFVARAAKAEGLGVEQLVPFGSKHPT